MRIKLLLLGALLLSPLLHPAMAGGGNSARAEDSASAVPVRVKRVLLVNQAPAVLLLDSPGERYLLMFIDFFMASAISSGMNGPILERPLTHDLIGILLRRLGGQVTKITITDLKNDTYYALISLRVNGEVEEIDARPSDALAIAVRTHAPIFAAGSLLRSVGESPLGGTDPPGGPGKPDPPGSPQSESAPPKGKT